MQTIKVPKDSIPDQPVKKVQMDALILSQILSSQRLSSQTLQSSGVASLGQATGQLLGVEEKGTLILTNSFQIPILNSVAKTQATAIAMAASHQTAAEGDEARTAASAALTFVEDESSQREFNAQMIEILEHMDYEVNKVGWYQCYTGSLIPIDEIIETQYQHQSENPQAIHIMYECKKTEYQSPVLTALRLTDEFMKFYATRNFGGKNVKAHAITHTNIFELLEIELKSSHLMNAVFGEFDLSITSPSSHTISSEKYLERQLDALIDCVEDQGQEFWRWQAWHRGYQKEHQKVNSTLSKMNYENEKSASAGKGNVVHNEAALAAAATSVGLGKSIAGEPGRLDTLILSRNIDMITDNLAKFCSAS